ncbi:MAG: DNA polymerase III subunit beta [Patescibacteria group bacterium]
MKIKCTQENLSKGLSVVNKAVSAKISLPILGNILFDAKNGVLTLSSSNLETSISASFNAVVEENGAVAVPARMFTEFITNLPAESLEIFTEKNNIKLICGESGAEVCSAKFACMSAEDFPTMPTVKKGVRVNLNNKEFSLAVLYSSFCAAVGDSRPALTGVLLKKEGENLAVVATDGYRLTEKNISLSGDSSESADFSLLVPAKTLAEAVRIFLSLGEDIGLTYSESENLAVFECGQVLVAIRILDGEFPDYKRIIPTNFTLTAHSKNADLWQAIKTVSVFAKDAKEGNSLLRVSLDPVGECIVSSSSQQSGEGSAKIKMEVESPQPVSLAFNSKYLLDFFNSVKSEDLDIYSAGEASPCVFKSPQINDFLHLIMPVKLNS